MEWIEWLGRTETISAGAAVLAAAATVATAWLLYRDRKDRAESDLPFLLLNYRSSGTTSEAAIIAVNPGQGRWILQEIRCLTAGYEVADTVYAGRDDGYGNEVTEPGARGKRVQMTKVIFPAALVPPNATQVLGNLVIYGPEGGRPDIAAKISLSSRRRRTRRPTAIISITD